MTLSTPTVVVAQWRRQEAAAPVGGHEAGVAEHDHARLRRPLMDVLQHRGELGSGF